MAKKSLFPLYPSKMLWFCYSINYFNSEILENIKNVELTGKKLVTLHKLIELRDRRMRDEQL